MNGGSGKKDLEIASARQAGSSGWTPGEAGTRHMKEAPAPFGTGASIFLVIPEG